ncbi:hypothetical protein PGTUg99_010119 [Puccinia graminis f. sp. tritici]|uniref:DUF6589 domain-containing protein n=1 Tax=Puccinia graminis f. sp. tritici TaxID=56615 RepID=A0A5B0LJS8_PUCGR|nr:hypothetical protein PGTUg99_010119 [Puccinia graminis f. sp. tritici]
MTQSNEEDPDPTTDELDPTPTPELYPDQTPECDSDSTPDSTPDIDVSNPTPDDTPAERLPEDATENTQAQGKRMTSVNLEAHMIDYEGFGYSNGDIINNKNLSRFQHNGMQLTNSIRFDGCGVSETDAVRESMALTQDFAPLLCIDNLDMEERVQMSTIGHQSRMFHGTWGYIHIPSKDLWSTLNPVELSLEAYHNSLRTASSMVIDPEFFMPTDSPNDDYKAVWKSQIAQVMLKYVAKPSDRQAIIPLDPPPIDPISHEAPSIHMLKLMDESDNSAEGIGQVMEALRRQSGLEPEEFFGRLQLMEGDLGTSHTLWNIAYTILTYHFGNSNKMDDFGVWRFLEALGVSPEKVIQKKDFTKMLQHMEQVHEATLWHCIRTVMETDNDLVEEELKVLPSDEWNGIVETCYNRFCSPDARRKAKSFPQLNNLLVRLQDFSTVIEANRAMKAGDIGRLINIWKMWAFMTQSLPGLTHYSAYLPRLILLLTKVLPSSLAKLIWHTLLVSPSGRPNHFVAKDFFLENFNYWLKYFYTRGGAGTQVERLKNLYSSNIPLLRTMFHSLRLESGAKYIQQSHNSDLKMRALERFAEMAMSNDILLVNGKKRDKTVTLSIPDTYLEGIKCLQAEISGKELEVARFLFHLPIYDDLDNVPINEEEVDMEEAVDVHNDESMNNIDQADPPI